MYRIKRTFNDSFTKLDGQSERYLKTTLDAPFHSVMLRKPPKSKDSCSVCSWYCLLSVLLVLGALFLDFRLAKSLEGIQSTDLQGIAKWCGDWTPFGNLGNHTYNARLRSLIDDDILSCAEDSQVGQDYLPYSNQLFCRPPMDAGGRKPAILALDLKLHQRKSISQPEYTIIHTSHSNAAAIQKSVPSICKYTTGNWEVVFVLDAPYDRSLQVLREILISPLCLNSFMTRARVYVQPSPRIMETSRENLVMTASRPSHFYIVLPPAVVLQDRGWNRELARVPLAYPDVFSVSGQCGSSPYYAYGRCNANNVQETGNDKRLKTENTNDVYLTETNNRGPVLWRADVLKQLGYLDEYTFFHEGGDLDDLNKRALLRGWFPSYKYVNFLSNDEIQLSKRQKPGWFDGWWKRPIEILHEETEEGDDIDDDRLELQLADEKAAKYELFRKHSFKNKHCEVSNATITGSKDVHPYRQKSEKRILPGDLPVDVFDRNYVLPDLPKHKPPRTNPR
jgi:glycosyltransferase involved in cell wall biosynthesis